MFFQVLKNHFILFKIYYIKKLKIIIRSNNQKNVETQKI